MNGVFKEPSKMSRRHQYAETLRRPAHISHRGGAKVEPENTLTAFTRAVNEFRTDVLELDVHLTKEGVLVVHHDSTVERCTNGKGPIASHSLAELQRLDAGFRFSPDGSTFPRRGQGVRIPTLREVLTTLPEVRVNVEVKPDVPGIELVLADEVRALNAVKRLCIGSELDTVAQRLVEVMPEACHFFPREALAAFVLGALSGAKTPPDPRFHIADMPAEYQGLQLITPELVRLAHAHGVSILVWTIDDEAQMRALLEAQVDGLMTDKPDVLRNVLDAW
jgi:glycerophosphoryl diester phosphodiesterase